MCIASQFGAELGFSTPSEDTPFVGLLHFVGNK